MAINVVAYIGIESSDIILYLSRILAHLGKKVLIVDHSDASSIIDTVPRPEGIEIDQDIITYRQVDYTTANINDTMLEYYDDILISYGYQDMPQDINYCNRFVYVTDLYSHNYNRINEFQYELSKQSKTALLIKEAIELDISPEMVKEKIKPNISKDNITVLYRDERDYSNSILCHYQGVIRFKEISKQLKNYLLKEIYHLYPQMEPRILTNAYRRARKGD